MFGRGRSQARKIEESSGKKWCTSIVARAVPQRWHFFFRSKTNIYIYSECDGARLKPKIVRVSFFVLVIILVLEDFSDVASFAKYRLYLHFSSKKKKTVFGRGATTINTTTM